MRKPNKFRVIGLGETYVHTKTGTEYVVVDKCMVQVKGEWQEGIIYRSETRAGKFVRTSEDFRTSFRPRAIGGEK